YLSGREFTVGIIGTGQRATAIGAMEIVVDKTEQQGIYSYKSKQEYKKWVTYKTIEPEIEKECKKIALDVWKALNCFDGGRVDLKMDGQGILHFLEVNPLAGLNPIDSDLPILAALNGISYQNLIRLIMKNACERLEIKHEF
ncbi:MAG: D-alanine--D-alanine ligase, partial [Candidatus Cloacimonetes bacterium]|nr:D-alanine--D-alanine ligase [Candidatus Cloacimonadota bacterium]